MNKRKEFLGQYVVVVMFGCFMIVSLIGGFIGQIIKTNEYNKELASLNKEIKDIDKEIKSLKNEKSKLGKDEYIQEIARNRLKMIKPNEIIYIDINKGSN